MPTSSTLKRIPFGGFTAPRKSGMCRSYRSKAIVSARCMESAGTMAAATPNAFDQSTLAPDSLMIRAHIRVSELILAVNSCGPAAMMSMP